MNRESKGLWYKMKEQLYNISKPPKRPGTHLQRFGIRPTPDWRLLNEISHSLIVRKHVVVVVVFFFFFF